MDFEAINRFIQEKLLDLSLEKVKLTDAAKWLDEEGLLKDNPNHPGSPLRNIIETKIKGAKKDKSRWYLYPVNEKTKVKKVVPKKTPKEEKSTANVKMTEYQGSLKQLNEMTKDKKAIDERFKNDPVGLIACIRDQTRVSMMQIARDSINDYDIKTNMIDTISLLYQNKMLGKVTVQCLEVIRKVGNLAQYEKEHLTETNSSALAEMVCRAFNVYYNEAIEKGLIRE